MLSHPATRALKNHPRLTTTRLSCEICGEEWAVPANPKGQPDVAKHGPGITLCPACHSPSADRNPASLKSQVSSLLP